MTRPVREGKPAQQAPLMRDQDPPVDLSRLPNDADDTSDAGMPTSDHEAEGWRETHTAKP